MKNGLKYGFVIIIMLLPAVMGNAHAQSGASGIDADDQFRLTGAFASPVPLLVLDFGNSLLAGPGSNTAIVSVIDNGDRPNRISDTPQAAYRLLFEEDSGGNRKKSYHFELEPGAESPVVLVGLPAGRQWSLRGSDVDKSMLRNYLALQMAQKIKQKAAPQATLCEVVIKQGGNYYYEGVYLFSEYIKNGVFMADRVAREQVRIVRVVAPQNDEFRFVYELVKFEANVAPESAVMPFVSLEQALNRNDGLSFFGALDKMRVGTFFDTFLLFNGLANYREDMAPFYFYMDARGRVGVSPLWLFDECLDNAVEPYEMAVSPDRLYPWFDRLSEYNGFNTDLRKRFFDLDKKAWNVLKVQTMIDDIVNDLGPALERDWLRWEAAYNARPLKLYWWRNQEERIRQTATPVQEIIKMRYLLREQNLLLKDFMDKLQYKKVQFTESKRSNRVFVFTVGFIAVFFMLVIFSRRRF